MADFIATTASNDPKLTDHEAVEHIIAGYYFDPDFNVGVGFDHVAGDPFLFIYGHVWPEAWKLEGVSRDDFDPYGNEDYERGEDDFENLLKKIVPHLAEPLTVQAIGSVRCRFPLASCEWHIEPGSQEIEVTRFRHSSEIVKEEVPA